jgi:hypothetical protein
MNMTIITSKHSAQPKGPPVPGLDFADDFPARNRVSASPAVHNPPVHWASAPASVGNSSYYPVEALEAEVAHTPHHRRNCWDNGHAVGAVLEGIGRMIVGMEGIGVVVVVVAAGRRTSLVEVLWILGGRIGDLVVGGERWVFGMGTPSDDSLRRGERRRLERRGIVVAAVVDSCWVVVVKVVVVSTDIRWEKDLADGTSEPRQAEAFFEVVS